uniref:Squalene synthase n=1 Tax=Puccinia cf. psidii AE-2014 TaxID=1505670 RepID=A0A060IP22_9BASI|nr:farnesyl-diphosphate farnesyltransferase [Puccinia cf. psidii AE-2014]
MNVFQLMGLALCHPNELKVSLNYKIWYEPSRRLEDDPEVTRIHYPTMKACWHFLDQTSRSFSSVIKELEGELSRAVCIFYLVLRGLDTIEDDMTIEFDLKDDLLKKFHLKLDQSGWNFDGCQPKEKDRQLLVEFDKVIAEFQNLDIRYRSVISYVTARMGSGMAKFLRTASKQNGVFSIHTLTGYDTYCHYVAGIVGEGLSRLFSCSGKEDSQLCYQIKLSNSMGLFLQKTNILRDFREDVDNGRMFWPQEVWGKFVAHPRHLTQPQNQRNAKWALTEMTIDALNHSIDSLEYLTLLKNQSIFNFCAIPQVMAIATLEKCFQNLDVFHKNVKIRRSLMVLVISKAVNPRDLSYIFVDFAQRIHARADPEDPNYLKLCIIVGQITAWTENRYPSFIEPSNPPPLYSDDPTAKRFTDVRMQQQPQLAKSGISSRTSNSPSKLGFDDLKFVLIIVSIVLGLIIVTSVLLGIIVYFVTKVNRQVFFHLFVFIF